MTKRKAKTRTEPGGSRTLRAESKPGEAREQHKGPRQMVFALIDTIFAQKTAQAAHAQWRVVSDQLREKFPRLAAKMDGAEQEVLSFMDFPRSTA